jgi:hypothetical protein
VTTNLDRPVWLSRFELSPGKWVYVPDEKTKAFGLQLKSEVESLWQPPDYFIHLGNRGHVRALNDHLANAYFARIDLKSFFGSIRKGRITRNLNQLFHNYPKARAATVMSTVPLRPVGADKTRFVLPFGFVQSPLIAGLCLANSKLGSTLARLAKAFTLTVYVDDILISTSESVDALAEAYQSLLKAAVQSGFVINEEKLSPPSKAVTVFNIDLETQLIRINDTRLSKFVGSLQGASAHQIDGILGYVRSVNEEQAQQLEDSLG